MVARGSRGARMLATMSAGSGSSSIMGEPYTQFSTEDGKEHMGCVHDAVRDVYHPKDANNIDVAAMEKAIKASPEILARLAVTDDSLFIGPICSAMLKIVRAIAPRPGASRLDAADEAPAAATDAAAAAAAAAKATAHIAAVAMDNATANDIVRPATTPARPADPTAAPSVPALPTEPERANPVIPVVQADYTSTSTDAASAAIASAIGPATGDPVPILNPSADPAIHVEPANPSDLAATPGADATTTTTAIGMGSGTQAAVAAVGAVKGVHTSPAVDAAPTADAADPADPAVDPAHPVATGNVSPIGTCAATEAAAAAAAISASAPTLTTLTLATPLAPAAPSPSPAADPTAVTTPADPACASSRSEGAEAGTQAILPWLIDLSRVQLLAEPSAKPTTGLVCRVQPLPIILGMDDGSWKTFETVADAAAAAIQGLLKPWPRADGMREGQAVDTACMVVTWTKNAKGGRAPEPAGVLGGKCAPIFGSPYTFNAHFVCLSTFRSSQEGSASRATRSRAKGGAPQMLSHRQDYLTVRRGDIVARPVVVDAEHSQVH